MESDLAVPAIVGERLTLAAFNQLSGQLAGYAFVKCVVDKTENKIHFLNHNRYPFHVNYIGERLLGMSAAQVDAQLDELNRALYVDLDRRFFLGVLALHKRAEGMFFSLETVEVDVMTAEMMRYFYHFVREHLDPAVPLFFKPANHFQEALLSEIDKAELPRVFSHELFESAQYIALNPGSTWGRLRAFENESHYTLSRATLEWFDIIVMHKVPDDIPRLAGIINASHTTPLSHTNVLASGWQVPNCIQLGIFDRIRTEALDGQWVDYVVSPADSEAQLRKTERPAAAESRPTWSVNKIKLEEPETGNTPILPLDHLRMSDRYRYGTKAANLGELRHILENGSERLAGFYRIRRAPRPNLLPYLAKLFGVPETADLNRAAWDFLRRRVKVPRGIAIPFSVQREFLESSPQIQQGIGKLKMALELGAREIDSLCLSLQVLIRNTRMPEKIRTYIDSQIALELAGVSSFVVRSSSNAEDLEHFSAAGIYESINHVTTAQNVFDGVKEVWGSLLSPRSVRLRQEVGISLDDSYMGVIIQEEIPSLMGGVMVTTNPASRGDFRNVYLNVSTESVNQVVDGSGLPYQCLYNTVEGGGRTLSLGSAKQELSPERKAQLQGLALAGRLLQSHFSPDYTFSAPVDIEWLLSPAQEGGMNVPGSSGKAAQFEDELYILQLRPFAR